jgi:hypothetical protein
MLLGKIGLKTAVTNKGEELVALLDNDGFLFRDLAK